MGFSIIETAGRGGSQRLRGVSLSVTQHKDYMIANIAIGDDIRKRANFKAGDKIDVLVGDGPDAGRFAIQKGSSYTLFPPNSGGTLRFTSRAVAHVIGHPHKSSECQIIESECAQGRIVFSLPPKVFARMSADTASVAAVA